MSVRFALFLLLILLNNLSEGSQYLAEVPNKLCLFTRLVLFDGSVFDEVSFWWCHYMPFNSYPEP